MGSVSRSLDRNGRIGLLLTAVVAAGLIGPKIVWGPCFGDPGEVQLTAAVGGVGHPPGQAGVISIMRGLCLASPLEPHVTVSAANGLFAWMCVVLLTLFQLRTGANPIAAGLCSLWFLSDDQFWHAATVPETYATCMVLLTGSMWAFFRWLSERRAWQFGAAVLLFVFLVVNRAPTLPLSVAYVAALLHHRGARSSVLRAPGRLVAIASVSLVIAVSVTWGALWLRDVPGSEYNYLDQSHASLPEFPASNVTAADRAARLWWLVSAKQYAYMFEPSRRTIRGQFEFLSLELSTQYPLIAAAAAALMALGAWTLYARYRTLFVFVLLLIPGAVVPILFIRVVHHTAMLPNLLFPLIWLAGLGMSRLMAWCGTAAGKTVVVAAFAGAFWWTADRTLLDRRDAHDASAFAGDVGLRSLPQGAVLIAADVIPLVYEQQVRGVRPDLTVLLHLGRLNREYLSTLSSRVFTTETLPPDLEADLIGEGRAREIRLRAAAEDDPPVE